MRTSRRPTPVRTVDHVLDVAERLMQTRGYNGFSYADVSDEIGITKASLHYHFPSKAELGRALLERYRQVFVAALEAIGADSQDAVRRLERYVQLYRDVLSGGRMCLCGMLAAEYATLPETMQRAIRAFFDANELWLAQVLEDGRAAGQLAFPGSPRDTARLLTAALEGAMLLARSYGDASRLANAARLVIAEFVAEPASRAEVGRSKARAPASPRAGSARRRSP